MWIVTVVERLQLLLMVLGEAKEGKGHLQEWTREKYLAFQALVVCWSGERLTAGSIWTMGGPFSLGTLLDQQSSEM